MNIQAVQIHNLKTGDACRHSAQSPVVLGQGGTHILDLENENRHFYVNQKTGNSALSDRPAFKKPVLFPVERSVFTHCQKCLTDSICETYKTVSALTVTRIMCECSVYVFVRDNVKV